VAKVRAIGDGLFFEGMRAFCGVEFGEWRYILAFDSYMDS
jgi:hypothetical protein